MNLLLRWASTEDQSWVDAQYAAIDFSPSDLKAHRVTIAEWLGQPAGLGRLVPVATQQWELGGMYVLSDFRRKGIAAAIVQHLIDHTANGGILYCLPFMYLTEFYQGFGFQPAPEIEIAGFPTPILDKWQWCNEHYESAVDLLVMQR